MPKQTQNVTITNNGTLKFNLSADQTLVTGSPILTLTGSGGFIKTGTAKLWSLSGDNTIIYAFSGGTIDIQQGAFANGQWLKQYWWDNKAGMKIASGASLDLWDGGSDGTAKGFSSKTGVIIDALTGAGSVTALAGNAPGLFVLGINNGSGNFSGQILGGGSVKTISIEKRGTGTQTLSGNNTYAGTTAVSAGTLEIGAGGVSGTLGTGAVSVAGGAILQFNLDKSYSIQNTLTGSGTVSTVKGIVTVPESFTGTFAASGTGGFLLPSKTYLGAHSFDVGAKAALFVTLDETGTDTWNKTEFLALRASDAPFAANTNVTWNPGAVVGFSNAQAVNTSGMFGTEKPLYKAGAGELLLDSDQSNAVSTPVAIYEGTMRITNAGKFTGSVLTHSGASVVRPRSGKFGCSRESHHRVGNYRKVRHASGHVRDADRHICTHRAGRNGSSDYSTD